MIFIFPSLLILFLILVYKYWKHNFNYFVGVILILFILALINNFFFYDHIVRISNRTVEHIAELIDIYIDTCDDNRALEVCISDLKPFVEKEINYTVNTIEVFKNDTLLYIFNKTKTSKWDNVVNNNAKIIFSNDLEYQIPDETAYINNREFLYSIIRGMSLSIDQLIIAENKIDFFWTWSVRRSAPIACYLIISICFVWIYIQIQKKLRKKYLKNEAIIDEATKSKIELEEKINKKKKEIEVWNQKIAELKEYNDK